MSMVFTLYLKWSLNTLPISWKQNPKRGLSIHIMSCWCFISSAKPVLIKTKIMSLILPYTFENKLYYNVLHLNLVLFLKVLSTMTSLPEPTDDYWIINGTITACYIFQQQLSDFWRLGQFLIASSTRAIFGKRCTTFQLVDKVNLRNCLPSRVHRVMFMVMYVTNALTSMVLFHCIKSQLQNLVTRSSTIFF